MDGARRNAIDTLVQAGILNPLRLVKLMRETISLLGLDLSGLTVLTEAASGPYIVTPVIASLAGAERVIALTADSRYGSSEDVIGQTRSLEELCGAGRPAEIHTARKRELFGEADVVTNLGFVRPIDSAAVTAMKATAVVPLMCESWEFRPGDIDIAACGEKGIVVLGTNEDWPGLRVFDYSGWLCLKMLFEAQIEMERSHVVVVSSDRFGQTIKARLDTCSVSNTLLTDLRDVESRKARLEADVLVIADYTRKDVIIGPGGDIDGHALSRMCPAATVVQFAGVVDTRDLSENNIAFYPRQNPGYRRMAQTLAELGPRTVVELHCAGLKVGQALAEARGGRHMNPGEATEYALRNSPAQPF